MQKDIVIEKLLKVEMRYESILGHARSMIKDLRDKKITLKFSYQDLLESTLKFIIGTDENPSVKRKFKPDEKQEGKRVRGMQEREPVEKRNNTSPEQGELKSLEGNELYDMMGSADKFRVEKLWRSKSR